MRATIIGALCALLIMAASSALAGWQLNGEQSDLSFVSVKAGNLGEVHRFHKLTGSVKDDGAATVTIDLASVDTLIPVRDERLREILFEVANFPIADMQAKVPLDEVAALAVGGVQPMALEGTLNLKGTALPLTLQVVAARLAEHRVMVTSAEPVMVNAGSVGLIAGIEQLREIAGLPSISYAVPVNFVLVFDREVTVETSNARVREPIPGQNKTVGYFDVTNTGDNAVSLVSASSGAASTVELHTSIADGDMMRMRRLKDVPIEPGQTVSFRPGGHHLMVFGVGKLEETVVFTLKFSDGSALDVPFRRFDWR